MCVILTKLVYSNMNIETFKNDVSMTDVLKESVVKLFKDEKNIDVFQKRLVVMIDKMNEPKYKHLSLSYLKMINSEYTKLKASERKDKIKKVLSKVVEHFSKKEIDVSCISEISFCSSTELKGACGFLATKSKLMMTRNKEYKDKLEKVSNALGEIDKILET
jgi:hypothetical protein